MHRVTWDLTYTDAVGVAQRVGPGSYTLRMVVDGLERERPLEIVSLTDG